MPQSLPSDQVLPSITTSQFLAMYPSADALSTMGMDSTMTASTALPSFLAAPNTSGGSQATITGLSGIVSPSSAQLHQLIRAYGLLSPSGFGRAVCKRGHSISPISDLLIDPLSGMIRQSPIQMVAMETPQPGAVPIQMAYGSAVAPSGAAGTPMVSGGVVPVQPHATEMPSNPVFSQHQQDTGHLPNGMEAIPQTTAMVTESYGASVDRTSHYQVPAGTAGQMHHQASGHPLVMNNISVNVQTTMSGDIQPHQHALYDLNQQEQVGQHQAGAMLGMHTGQEYASSGVHQVNMGQACTVPGCTSCVHFAGNGVMPPKQEEIIEMQVCRWSNCQMQFADQEELVQHIEKLHIDQRHSDDFICMWNGCSRQQKPFNARYKLLIHMRVHSGEKPNKCTVSTEFFFV